MEPPKEAEKPTSPTEARPTSSSTLSAAAPSFAPASPSAPPPDVSTVDEFAQTGAGDDDLFDDVIPFEMSMQTRPPENLSQDEVTPVAPEVIEQPAPPTQQPAARGRGDGTRGRGRGRGRGGRKEPAQVQVPKEQQPEAAPVQADPPEDAPTGPKKDTPAAVRGDRRATGGVRKPKLTEAELSERMAAIQLKNASLTAAHARAEADAANFAEREQQAKIERDQRAKEERKDRQQMMGERERNRMRKLKAMEGREWDLDKNEDDFAKGGKQDGKPGGFGRDQADYTDGREYLYREPRGGRGGGRGGAARGGKQTPDRPPNRPPKQEDFPALPGGRKDNSLASEGATGKSWAEQVETAGSG